MSDILRDLFYHRYDPMEEALPNRVEYDAIYEELEQTERELWKTIGEQEKGKLRRLSILEAQLRDMAFGDYFAEGFYLAVGLLRGGWSPQTEAGPLPRRGQVGETP